MTFTAEEVANLAGVTLATAKRWIKAKKLKASRVRCYAIEAADVRNQLIQRATE
jgi:excisionase family DNA binding protein